MLIRAQKEIDESGIITFTEKGYGVAPAVKVWKAASETLLKTADRLGLHPGARSKLQLPERGEQPKSKFAGLIGRTP